MSLGQTSQRVGSVAAPSIYRELWVTSLDACFLLRCERDSCGDITDFVFDDMNSHGAATLGLAKQAAIGKRLCEVVPIQRGGGLLNRYVDVADSGVTLVGAAVPPYLDSAMNRVEPGESDEPPAVETALPFVTRHGATRELRSVVVPLLDEYGVPEFVLGIAEDITELSAARARLERHANHDALAGLPNRRLFMDRLTHALEGCGRSNKGLSLLFIDLDNFKAVNDHGGHGVGDALLKEIGERLSRSARSVDTVCRLSGDEFTIVMEDLEPATQREADIVAKRVIHALSQPFALDGCTFTASIGISSFPCDGAGAVALLRRADDALYRAKRLGKNRHRHFSRRLDGDTAHRTVFERARGVAIARAAPSSPVDEVSSG